MKKNLAYRERKKKREKKEIHQKEESRRGKLDFDFTI